MTEQYEKHTTHTDALDTLGSIIGDGEKRDAIHLAVEPVIAHVRVSPGQHVVLGTDGEASPTDTGNGVGIVDPFLEQIVEPGERFWLVVYPRQITSLRHVWEHPDFPPSGETDVAATEPPGKAASEQWLHDWIKRADCPDFHTVIGAALSGQTSSWDDDYMHFNDVDAHGEIPDEFWHHLEIYVGHPVDGPRPKWFSCSC